MCLILRFLEDFSRTLFDLHTARYGVTALLLVPLLRPRLDQRRDATANDVSNVEFQVIKTRLKGVARLLKIICNMSHNFVFVF